MFREFGGITLFTLVSSYNIPIYHRGFNCLATTFLNANTRLERRAGGLVFGYTGENNPESWKKFNETCAVGKFQSPLDFENDSLLSEEIPQIHWTDYEHVEFHNTGNTVEVALGGANHHRKTTLVYKSNPNEVFTLQQFHFHDPSEHTVTGSGYPLEAHFVFKSEKGSLAVFGVFMQFSDVDGSRGFLHRLVNYLPKVNKPTHIPVLKLKKFGGQLNYLAKKHGVYRYQGSLTTPPCSEGVNWNVLKKPVGASSEILAGFWKSMPMNSRYTQNPHGRGVTNNVTGE
ncbi:hypothetical protein HK099_008057 [Clydaea vesicula]|uniref:Carbonic anhydrase n=1 Tax=Clydaea vesicula TaxID=447962 RepID=A0AAD5U0J9_9FUNG|nr:hypothetical protein HK099_008057 [Clydaea vesicula]